MAIDQVESAAAPKPNRPGIADCDVHNALAHPDALKPYLESRWHEYYDQGHSLGHPGQIGMTIGARPAGLFRGDSVPEIGVPGSDYETLRRQLLEGLNVDRALLCPLDSSGWVAYGELGAALCTALNRWMAAEWLDRDSRLYGVISVTPEDGPAAAAEIRRVAASDPRFVAVLVLVQTREGLGHPKYRPIFEAATEYGLPIFLHAGGFSGSRYSAGWPAFYLEHHVQIPHIYATQVISLIYAGVPERFPGVQFVLSEGGVGWLAPLMWRMDRVWETTRDRVPHLTRAPSEVMRECLWLTTQPLDDPNDRQQLLQMLDHLGMTHRLMYSSDYPHWDFDDPTRVLPRSVVGDDVRQQVFSANADRCFPFNHD